MRFCPRCGSLMLPQRMSDGKLVWKCRSCGYVEDSAPAQPLLIRQQIKHSEKERIVVIDDSVEKMGMTITRAVCPKCGNEQAYAWVMQTRRADEPPTRFFKCTRCGHVWREYD